MAIIDANSTAIPEQIARIAPTEIPNPLNFAFKSKALANAPQVSQSDINVQATYFFITSVGISNITIAIRAGNTIAKIAAIPYVLKPSEITDEFSAI